MLYHRSAARARGLLTSRLASDGRVMTPPENQLEDELLDKLRALKYEHRPDIRDRASLEQNLREKFESLNHVRLTNAEFPLATDGSALKFRLPITFGIC
jgi:hypothetical protein